jgi:uncharacterized membrane protein
MQLKKVLQLSGVLTWINLIISAILVFFALASGLLMVGLAATITPIVMWGSVIVHSYAVLQLRKSLIHGAPLQQQTAIGIRFIGWVAIFIAVIWAATGMMAIQNAKEVAQQLTQQVQLPPEYKNIDMSNFARGIGAFFLFLSFCVITNVIINIRLLRLYHQDHQE